MRALLIAAVLALAGCQLQEPTLPGTVVAVTEAELPEDLEEDLEDSAKYYEHPLVPEVAWKVDVRLDDGSEVSVIQNGPRRPEPGERVRLLKDSNGELFL